MTSTKDRDTVLMMHSSMQSRKNVFSVCGDLFHNDKELFSGIDTSLFF